MMLANPFKSIKEFIQFRDHDDMENQRVVRQIQKAWAEGSGLDDMGKVWVDIRFLHTILRTNKPKARFRYNQAPASMKLIYEGHEYLNGSAILGMLDKEMSESSTRTRSDFLRVSRNSYLDIVDSSDVESERDKVREKMNKQRRKLKQKRISEMGVTEDELTGEALDKSSSDFSHIRSFSHHPEYGTYIENGLVVNKSTHEVITSREINDEEALYGLCKEKGWRTDWYEPYKKWIRLREMK